MRRRIGPFHASRRKCLCVRGLAGLVVFSFAELHAKCSRLQDSPIVVLGHVRLQQDSAIEIHLFGLVHARPEIERRSVCVEFVLLLLAMTGAVHAPCPVQSSDPAFRSNQRRHLVCVDKHRVRSALRGEFRLLAVYACDGQKPARAKCRVQFQGEFSGGQPGRARIGFRGAQNVKQFCIPAEVETGALHQNFLVRPLFRRLFPGIFFRRRFEPQPDVLQQAQSSCLRVVFCSHGIAATAGKCKCHRLVCFCGSGTLIEDHAVGFDVHNLRQNCVIFCSALRVRRAF